MKHKIGFIFYALFIAFAAGLLIATVRMASGSFIRMPGGGVYLMFALPLLATGIATCSCWQDNKVLTDRLAWTFTLNGVAWAIILLYFLAGWIGLFPMTTKVEAITVWLSIGAALAMFVSGGFGIGILFATEHHDD